jgi:glycosyltransferase involved in cell wall biosynthesis
MVEDLKKLGYGNLHIIDNNSTYTPLREWYDTCGCEVVRLDKNLGQLAVYNSGYINNFKGWIAYTDSDIELNKDTPSGFVERLIRLAEKYNYNKAGLALRLDDLPDTEYGNYARHWEKRYWEKELEKDVYIAGVDTTFSVIKVGLPFQYESIRVAGNMTARHMPWYLDYNNLSEEETFVIKASNSEFSTTKRFVDSRTTGS